MRRMTVNLSDEMFHKIGVLSERLGLSKTQLGGLCIQAGYGQLMRVIAPEEVINPEIYAKVMMSLKEQGVDIASLGQ